MVTSLSTKRTSVAKSIRYDLNIIRHEFERRFIDDIVWIPGKSNLADPGTKSDTPLIHVLRLLMESGCLHFSSPYAEVRSIHCSLR